MHAIVILHGLAASLAIAAALHVYLLLRRRPFFPRGASLGLLLTLIAVYVPGWIAYPPFRGEVRFDLVRTLPWVVNLFDVKEFLSWGALLAGVAISAMGLRRRERIPEGLRPALRILTGFVIAVLVFNTAVGVYIGSRHPLPADGARPSGSARP